MKAKIVLIIPYWGKLPGYFKAFLHSCRPLDGLIDFLLFSDDGFCLNAISFPRNFRANYMTFDQFSTMAERMGIGRVYTPYKSCDFRPTYGLLFQEHIKEYEFWGYCDIDMMFGDVSGFLKEINYESYDRVGRYGHFTIYRNNEYCNTLYQANFENSAYEDVFSNVVQTTFPCNFDEVGMNHICKVLGLRFYEQNSVFDTARGTMQVHTWQNIDGFQLLTWEKGHCFSYTYGKQGDIEREERAYIHFGAHKQLRPDGTLQDMLLLHESGIIPFNSEIDIEKLMVKYGRPDTYNERKKIKKQQRLHRCRVNLNRLYNEMRWCRIRSVYNMYQRYLLAKKNNFFLTSSLRLPKFFIE